MAGIYQDGSYLNKHPSWHEEDSPWKAEQVRKIVERNQLAPTSICEIGCGAGEILKQLSEHLGPGKNFFGYEVSPQAFELCSRKSSGNLRFFLKDLLEEAETSFDLVMAIDVFEHVEDYWGFLRRLRTKGDYKIFHIPLDLSAVTVLWPSPILRGRQSMGHIHYFTKETALATLTDTGYEIIDYFYTASGLDLPNRGWKQNLVRLPRRVLFSINQDLAVRILGGYSLLVLAR